METKNVLCCACDLHCPILVDVENEKIVSIRGDTEHPVMPNHACLKATKALDYYDHPDRLLYPLKRKSEKGSAKWDKISWDQAMDEIAEKLKQVVKKYNPESVAMAWGTGSVSDGGAAIRFINLLGTPNWISATACCLGNTAAVSQATLGWFPFADYAHTNCIVLLGHNPNPGSWSGEDSWLEAALKRGAKLIVADPRKSYVAKKAHIHLRLRPGTDAAMLLGWVNVIISEGLYDKEFVEKWTLGFEDLKKRVQEYPLNKVEKITGVPADEIKKAAEMYATTKPAIIPWTVITDQQKSSTSAIRLQCLLKAITGNLDVPGGDLLTGFNPDIISESKFESHELISKEQREKAIGSQKNKALSWMAYEYLREPTKRVWGYEYANLCRGFYQVHPPSIWRTMVDGKPYPVKALISQGNNTLMGFANQQLIYKALKKLDILVVMDLFMTPTAQLADYVLPAACFLERPSLHNYWDWVCIYFTSEKVRNVPGECRTDYEFWRELGVRMGQDWPWKKLEELYEYRIKKLGLTWNEFVKKFKVYVSGLEFKKYEKIGFATPSGKVELRSSILEKLGCDSLPYYVEPPESIVSTPELAREYPYTLFIGLRDAEYFHTGQRMVKSFRRRLNYPRAMMHPDTAAKIRVSVNDWVWVETTHGKIKCQVEPSDDMPTYLIRVPHGWWLPEEAAGEPELYGAFKYNDGVLLNDEDKYLDAELGMTPLRGLLCKVYKV